MKIVFLDIDGVLNTGKNYAAYSQKIEEEPEQAPDVRGRIDAKNRHVEYLFDKSHIDVLNTITDKTGAKIVVSSSWRIWYSGRAGYPGFADLRGLLKRVGVTGEVIDRTPLNIQTRFSEYVPRGKEIQHWLNNDGKHLDVKRFVILDDDNDMEHLQQFHIWTDGAKGLTPEDGQEAILVLEGEEGYVPTRHRKRVPGAPRT